MTSQPQQEAAAAPTVTATLVPMQGVVEGCVAKPISEKAGQAQVDADIFDALFSKWGQDAAAEEANIGSSFDDLLWDEGTATAAAAAASLGWQRSCTPLNLLSSSRAMGSEQQQLWDSGLTQQQQQQQDKQFAREYLLSSSQVASGPSNGEQDTAKQQQPQQPRSVVSQQQPANSNSCSDAQGKMQNAASLHPPAAEAAAKAKTEPAVGASDLQYSVQAMQQLLTGSCPAPVPAAAAPAAAQQPEEVAAGSQHMLNALNTAQQQLTLQQLQFSAAFTGVAAGGEVGRVLPQLSMQAMLHLQQQMLTSTQTAPQQPPQQQPQQVQQPQQAQQQQQPVPMNSMFAYQLSAQHLAQQAQAAAVGSWPPLPAAATAAGMGAVPDTSVGQAVADTALQANAWQQQQVRSAGLPAGLPFPGAGPGPGLLGNNGPLHPPASAPFGFSPLPGALLLGEQAALCAAAQAAQQPAAWHTHVLQQQEQQQQQQHIGAPHVGEQLSAPWQAAAAASAGDQTPLTQQSLSALLGAIGSAAAAPAGAAGHMGPPPPHLPNLAAATATAPATGGAMLPLPQQHPHMPHLLQPMLPPDLLTALGMGPMGQTACEPGAAAGLAPLFPGSSWQMQLAGLLRPPPMHTTSFLQLAMMMQAAMQASTLSGGADTQQAAMVVAALQGLACNMRMLMPWNSPSAWQQQPQQQQLNGSCLANGPMLHRQLSSSYGIGGQKATMQFGSQPQTSTTDISGQGLPGCHSHSTAVAGLAAGLGEKAEPAARSKQKRKVRHNDNRARYEGRKMRANNRMRIKGRFVKMGPNGEPILPGEMEAAEAENHTAVTHSDHDGSDAELSDPETHEHQGSGGMPSAVMRPGAGDTEQAGHTAEQPEPVMPPAGDTAEMAVSGDSYGGQEATRTPGFRAMPGSGAADTFLLKAGSQACCVGPAGSCEVCRASPAAGDRACLGPVAGGGYGGQQASCSAADRALGHANDGPCCCDDEQHRSQSPAANGKSCGVSSTRGLMRDAVAEGSPGDNVNRLPRQQQRRGCAAAGVSSCSEGHTADVYTCVSAAEAPQQVKRPLAAVDQEAAQLVNSSTKRQANEVLSTPNGVVGAVGAVGAAGAPQSHTVQPQAAAVGSCAGVINAPECTLMQDVLQQQTAELKTAGAAAALDPAEAAAAIVAADVVEQQHQILVRQASEAAAAETAAIAQFPARLFDKDHGSKAASRQQVQQLPAAAVAHLPAAVAAQPAASLHPHPPAAALLNHLAAASHPALQQWSAVHAVSQVLHPGTTPVPAQLPGSMLPPAARPPAGVWGHNGVAALGALSAVHAVRPGVATGGDVGMQLPASADMLAGASFAAMQSSAAGGLGPVAGHGLHMGLAPWALQQHMMGPPGQHLLSPASSLAAAAVGMAGLPLVRPGTAVVGGGQPMLGPQLMPVALPGGWPLAAAVAGKWVAPRVGRQRRRGGKNAKEGSEQTDSCLN